MQLILREGDMENFPLLRDAELKPAVKILTDYPRDDLASDEVHQALVTACAHHGVNPYNLDVGAIPGMDTVVAGFKTAQLALNSKLGFGHVIHTNCAPRKNIVTAESKGEGVVLGILPNGVCLLTVSSGYSLAPFRPMIEDGSVKFFKTRIPDAGSQFRSRDYFPDATARLARYLQDRMRALGPSEIYNLLAENKADKILENFEYIAEPMDLSHFTPLPQGSVCYIDNFGNIKLNIPHDDLVEQYEPGTILAVSIGDTIVDAIVGTAGFSQGEGILALTRGSSGWMQGANNIRFTEIFLRGESAANVFKSVKPGSQIQVLAKKDLQDCIKLIQESGHSTIGTLNLYMFSESHLVQLLAIEGLIEDGYKTDKLKNAISNGSIVNILSGAEAA